MYKFTISTKGKNDIIDMTPQIDKFIKKSKIKEGICLISSPGSTCGITTIEYEPNLIEDFKEFLEKLAPSDKDYRHDKTWPARLAPARLRFAEGKSGRSQREAGGGEKNGQSHILSALIKPFLIVPIDDGKLLLGQWQQIVFIDFDSRPRERTIIVKI